MVSATCSGCVSQNNMHDLVHQYADCSQLYWYGLGIVKEENALIEEQWKALPSYINDEENTLVMVDVSGSMYGRPIEISMGLGIYFAERMKETEGMGDEVAVAGGLTVHYAGTSSCLFGGALNLLRNNLRASHYFNFRRICRSIALDNDVHDLGYVLLKPTVANPDGTLGPCEPREDFEGICAFKKSFGADYIEYIGEYVLVANKLKYFAYEKLFGLGKTALHVVNKVVKKTR